MIVTLEVPDIRLSDIVSDVLLHVVYYFAGSASSMLSSGDATNANSFTQEITSLNLKAASSGMYVVSLMFPCLLFLTIKYHNFGVFSSILLDCLLKPLHLLHITQYNLFTCFAYNYATEKGMLRLSPTLGDQNLAPLCCC